MFSRLFCLSPVHSSDMVLKISDGVDLIAIFNLSRGFIIDGLSVERNHILVRMNVIGGPSERILPPRTLEEVSAVKSGGVYLAC